MRPRRGQPSRPSRKAFFSGYAAHTVSSYVLEVTHFARWVCTRRLPLARISKSRWPSSLTTTCRVALALATRGMTGPTTARRLGTGSSCFARKVPLRSQQSARRPWMRNCVAAERYLW